MLELAVSNGVWAAEQGAQTLRSVIDGLAESSGGAPFLISPESTQSLTFADLRRDASALAERLASLGLSKGARVAFILDNGIFTAELFLSIIYAGYVAVPLNMATGKAALAQIVRDSGTQVVFVSKQHSDLLDNALAEISQEVIVIEFDANIQVLDESFGTDAIASKSFSDKSSDTKAGAPLHTVHPEDDALIAYTSGSTGQPKGAVFSHGNIIAGGKNTLVAHELTDRDRSLCVLPLYHMNAQIVTLMSTLLSGGSVVVPQHFNANAFWRQVKEYQCTWFALVPTIITQLLQRAEMVGTEEAQGLEHVRFARSSSAPLSPKAHEEFEERFGLPMIEAMGMTEAGGAIFSNPLPPEPRKIGSPGLAYGFDVRIIDSQGQQVTAGVAGEIQLRGPSIMQRYHKASGSESLWASQVTADGFLSTGDLARQDEDGFVFIVGRIADVINKGGEKFVPREIEELLLKHPAVLEAAIVGVADQHWGQDAVAYIVFKPGQSVSADALSSLCDRELGPVKTPCRFNFLPALPKGTAHKIDRKALAALAALEVTAANGSAPPQFSRTPLTMPLALTGAAVSTEPIDQLVLKAMSETLVRPSLEKDDNFFNCGGHSLKALQMINRLSRELRLSIPVACLFRYPTAALLAAYIDGRLASGNSSIASSSEFARSLVAIKAAGRNAPIFLTPGGNGADEEFLVYARLAGHFDDQPFFGFQARSSMQGVTPHRSVEAMAADYLKEVREFQPVGPYYLAGECSGGVIAYEMARQLVAAGEQVAFLALLDSRAPDLFYYTGQRIRWAKARINQILSIALKHAPWATKSAQADRAGESAAPTPASGQPVLTAREKDARWISYKRALLTYRPKPYNGKLLLVLSEEYKALGYESTWKPLVADGIEAAVVPSDHKGYLRDHAPEIAEIVGPIFAVKLRKGR